MYLCILTQATIKCEFLRDKTSYIIIINIISRPKPVSWFETISLIRAETKKYIFLLIYIYFVKEH